MEAIYYSVYPWMDPEADAIEDPRPGFCGDVWVQPFRLYKAATCTTSKKDSVKEFLEKIFEALDMPEVEDIHSPFTVGDIQVIPTKHLYGATNCGDGIYECQNKYYAQYSYNCSFEEFDSWKEAFDFLLLHGHRKSYSYLGGIDYTKR